MLFGRSMVKKYNLTQYAVLVLVHVQFCFVFPPAPLRAMNIQTYAKQFPNSALWKQLS